MRKYACMPGILLFVLMAAFMLLSAAAEELALPEPAFPRLQDYLDWTEAVGYPEGFLIDQGYPGLYQDYFHTRPGDPGYLSGRIVIGDSRCCQLGIFEQRTGRSDFAVFAVWGGHYAASDGYPVLTAANLAEIERCLQAQLQACGNCVVSFFATINDYDYVRNDNSASIQAALRAAEQVAALSWEADGRLSHPEVIVIGFDGFAEAYGEINRWYPEFNERLGEAVLASESLSAYTTVPEIVGGKAGFLDDGLHYDDATLKALVQYIIGAP